MFPGLVGQKIGMTRIFTEQGDSVPVSVVLVTPNIITQIKTPQLDGYNAIQVTTGLVKKSRLNKPLKGHYAKASVEPGAGLWEFKVEDTSTFTVGNELTVKVAENITYIDVIGVSKGKGFEGVIKRHNFSSQDSTHGNSLSHRVPGSIGQRQSPGKVFKGKKMAGHLGNKQVTVQNLKLYKIDAEKNLLFIEGSIPGHPNSFVMVFPAKKVKTKEEEQK